MLGLSASDWLKPEITVVAPVRSIKVLLTFRRYIPFILSGLETFPGFLLSDGMFMSDALILPLPELCLSQHQPFLRFGHPVTVHRSPPVKVRPVAVGAEIRPC